MSAQITMQHAKQIIKKLKAKRADAQPKHHKLYEVVVNGVIVVTFQISHTVKKGKPQSHLPEALHLNVHDTKELAQCNLSAEEYYAYLLGQP